MANKMMRRVKILQFHLSETKKCEIFKIPKNSRTKHRIVDDIIKRYKYAGSKIDRKRSCGSRSVWTPAMVKAQKSRIWPNPRRCQKKLALLLNVSRSANKVALTDDPGLRAMRRETCHMITNKQTKFREIGCRALLERCSKGSSQEIFSKCPGANS